MPRSRPSNATANRARLTRFECKLPEEPPIGLDDYGRAIWDQVREDYAASLKASDGQHLAAYCVLCQEFRKTAAVVAREGMIYTEPSGKMSRHPASMVLASLTSSMATISARLGINRNQREEHKRNADNALAKTPAKVNGLDMVA